MTTRDRLSVAGNNPQQVLSPEAGKDPRGSAPGQQRRVTTRVRQILATGKNPRLLVEAGKNPQGATVGAAIQQVKTRDCTVTPDCNILS